MVEEETVYTDMDDGVGGNIVVIHSLTLVLSLSHKTKTVRVRVYESVRE